MPGIYCKLTSHQRKLIKILINKSGLSVISRKVVYIYIYIYFVGKKNIYIMYSYHANIKLGIKIKKKKK
jgi:hypothetical protein